MTGLSLLTRLFTPRLKTKVMAPIRSRMPGEIRTVTDLGGCPPVLKAELALLRAFLGDEIDAILFGTEG